MEIVTNKQVIEYLQKNHIITERMSLNIRYKTYLDKKPEIAAVIVQATAFLRYSAPIKARLHVILQGLTEQPLCATCKKPTEMRLDGKFCYTFPIFCGSKCFSKDGKVKQKRANTNFEKYGTENAAGATVVREKIKNTTLERFGTEQLFSNPDVRERIKETNLQRYGVENPITSELIRKKVRETNLERYGAEHTFKSPTVREKIKQTMLERYGVENPFSSDVFQMKADQTMLERYGVKTPMQSEELKRKMQQTMLDQYGVEYALQNDELLKKQQKTMLEKHGIVGMYQKESVRNKGKETMVDCYGVAYNNQRHYTDEIINQLNDPEYLTKLHHNDEQTLTKIAEDIGVTHSTIGRYFKKHGIDVLTRPSSQGERELIDFVKSVYNKTIIANDRRAISPLEIDILLPEDNIAFEYNGIFWHSELNGKTKHYHLNKLNMCAKNNVRLIQITDKEWKEKQEIVKSRIKGFLGLNHKVYARKTQVVPITNKQAMTFFKDTHIQGAAGCTVAYGLKDESNNIIAVMSFGKSRFNKNVDWELVRYSSVLNTNVVGGASKLFQHFVRTHNPKNIITYSDKRWNTGCMYQQLGFSKKPDSTPNYYYFSLSDPELNLLHRVKFQKHKLSTLLETFDPSKTEWENMTNNGFDRIWDCGNGVYIWESSE